MYDKCLTLCRNVDEKYIVLRRVFGVMVALCAAMYRYTCLYTNTHRIVSCITVRNLTGKSTHSYIHTVFIWFSYKHWMRWWINWYHNTAKAFIPILTGYWSPRERVKSMANPCRVEGFCCLSPGRANLEITYSTEYFSLNNASLWNCASWK